MSDAAIRTEGLAKWFGSTCALDGLDLEVSPGQAYGFLGPNGAGKSTTIRTLLDLVRPTRGTVRVLGLDPRVGGARLRRRVGYLPGDFSVDGRRTSRELLRFLGDLRGGVPASTIVDLADRLGLELDRRTGTLSRGNHQKVGLVQAFMHHPELVVLDEPTNGLDPFVQREFASLVRETVAEGRTVFLSSHVMSEVQEIADRVGILRAGRLVLDEGVHSLTHRAVREVTLVFRHPGTGAALEHVTGVSRLRTTGSRLECRVTGPMEPFLKALAGYEVESLTAEEATLEDLFFETETRETSRA